MTDKETPTSEMVAWLRGIASPCSRNITPKDRDFALKAIDRLEALLERVAIKEESDG